MDAIRIGDLPALQAYALRDKINLQRREAGVWNDYHTDFGSYFGEYLQFTFDWVMSAPLGEVITCPVGKQLIPIAAQFTYEPGAGFTSTTVQISLSNSCYSLIGEFTHDGTGQGGIITPAVGCGAGWRFGALTEDLTFFSGFTDANGTCRIKAQYLLWDPI